jgi:hypothetical protein
MKRIGSLILSPGTMLLSIAARISIRRSAWLSGRAWIPTMERSQIWEKVLFSGDKHRQTVHTQK